MTDRLWIAIPASGAGRRMLSDIPKQYLPLAGRTVIQQTLDCFLKFEAVEGIVVGLATGDEYWPDLPESNHPGIQRCEGGAERSDTVLNMLNCLQGQADDDDWVMVHDAARPCVSQADLALLWQSREQYNDGAILAVPVHDTMKRATDDEAIDTTIDRSTLWHAYTPQMFRVGLLRQALQSAAQNGLEITDDASAMELAGYKPKLISGSRSNIKITRPEDLALAEFYLAQG